MQVAFIIPAVFSRLKTTNMRISPEYNLCSTNYTRLSPINILSKDYYSYILLKA